ncbi:MAG TPA: glycosyltransferase [Desulfuromonadaceae bacterium]
MTEKIYILLPVHNRRETTRRFITSLTPQTYRNFHLVLIDDGSSDGTADMVRGEIGDLTVLKGRGDWWWGGSLQQGYDWLRNRNPVPTDLVLIINDDCTFEPDFLGTAITLLSGHEHTLLQAYCYSRQDGRLVDAGVHVDFTRFRFAQAAAPEQINCLSTRGLFLRISDLFHTGGFYPRLLPHYLSDYEFTTRARRKGMRLLTDPSLRLWLDERTTGEQPPDTGPFHAFLKSYFSRKCAINPMRLSVFALLASPWHWKLVNVLRIWQGASVTIWRAFASRVSG